MHRAEKGAVAPILDAMPTVRIHDTLTGKQIPLEPIAGARGPVTFYSCGPTVYDDAHIGNFRSFLNADVLRRAIELTGMPVRHVMNITDVGHMTDDSQAVILPDLAAGCSMADMAAIDQVEQCWRDLETAGVAGVTIPITYMNSTAAIKAFTGRHGGTICTSSNAKASLEWAYARGEKVLFMPDQHLGRNTAVRDLGLSLSDCVVYNPRRPNGGLTVEQMRDARMILWLGHCSVHGRFTAECVDEVRERVPGVSVIVHPECSYEVVEKADFVGSTERIIAMIDAAPAGSKWAVGTELNLVKRLAMRNPDKEIVYLDRTVCFCSTMNRIDLPHLVWTLENLASGTVINRIEVDAETQEWARIALDRMLSLAD